MLSQVKECQGHQEREKAKEHFPLEPLVGTRPCQHLGLRLLDSGTIRELILVVLS